MDGNLQRAVYEVTNAIFAAQQTLNRESEAPSRGADQSDDVITESRKRLITLRKVRQELEELM